MRCHRDNRCHRVEHIIPPHLIGAIGQAVRVSLTGRAQQDSRGVRRPCRQDDKVRGIDFLLAIRIGADHLFDRIAAIFNLKPLNETPRQYRDIFCVHQRINRNRARIGFGFHQTRIPAAKLAAHTGRAYRVCIVAHHTERQWKRLPAHILFEVRIKAGDFRLVANGRMIIRLIARRLARISARLPAHTPQRFCPVIPGRQFTIRDWPGWRHAACMFALFKVTFAKTHQHAAIKGRVSADPIMRIGCKFLIVLVEPFLICAIFAVNEHRRRVPIVRLARKMLAAFQNENALTGISQSLRNGRPACARTNHDQIIMRIYTHLSEPLCHQDKRA